MKLNHLLIKGTEVITSHAVKEFNHIELSKAFKTIDKKDKIKPILIIRHLRYRNVYLDEINNLGGITVGFIINHENSTLTVIPAICANYDNFDKQHGVNIVKDRKNDTSLKHLIIQYTPKMKLVDNLIGFCLNVDEWNIDKDLNNLSITLIRKIKNNPNLF